MLDKILVVVYLHAFFIYKLESTCSVPVGSTDGSNGQKNSSNINLTCWRSINSIFNRRIQPLYDQTQSAQIPETNCCDYIKPFFPTYNAYLYNIENGTCIPAKVTVASTVKNYSSLVIQSSVNANFITGVINS